MVYSATSASAALGGSDPGFYLKREAIYALIGVALLMVASRTDYRALRFLAPVLILASIALSAAVLAVGEEVNGARRWLGVGSLSFQPSERSEEHTSELQSHHDLVCRLLLEKKKNEKIPEKINRYSNESS